MKRNAWDELIVQLRTRRVPFDAGLRDVELIAVESRFGFQFPPDLRELLQMALSQGPSYPDWRSGDDAEFREWLDVPRQGVLFDVEHNAFWLEERGLWPGTLSDALQRAGELVAAAPRLIPVYGHRLIADEPHLPGPPCSRSIKRSSFITGSTWRPTFVTSSNCRAGRLGRSACD